METYQFVAIGVMVAMALVVDSTLRLNSLRKKLGIARPMINWRDLAVVWQPQDFDAYEVTLVRRNWIACTAVFGLVILMLTLIPPDMVQSFPPG
jgi:hypothetical protein